MSHVCVCSGKQGGWGAGASVNRGGEGRGVGVERPGRFVACV